MPAGGHNSLIAMFHFQLCFCDNKPASSTGQIRDRSQSLGQVRAAQMETSEVAQAPLDNTALHAPSYCGNEFATNPPKLVRTLKTEKNLKTLKFLPVYNSNIKVAYLPITVYTF